MPRNVWKKIKKGQWQSTKRKKRNAKIPSKYSADLSNIISILLKLNPKDRPSIEELLENPIVQKHCEGIFEKETEQCRSLLKTIKFDDKNVQ